MRRLLLAVGCLTLVALPASAAVSLPGWRPPIVVWTKAPSWGGFFFGPYYFSNDKPLSTFLARFGHDERTWQDSFGFKHLCYFKRGLELTATTTGQVISFQLYFQPTPVMDGHIFASAEAQTDTGLGPGNTWNDVWTVQGAPDRQLVDEGGDRLWVLEYHLGNTHDLDFYFKRKASDEPIYRLGIFPRR